MADTNEDIEIALAEPENTGETEIAQPEVGSQAAETVEISPEEGIRALTAKLEAENAARIDAQRRGSEFEAQAQTANVRAKSSDLALLNNAVEMLTGNTSSLKLALKDAWAEGDFERAADIQSDLADNAAKLLRVNEGKVALEQEYEALRNAPAPRTQADPVDALASQLSYRSGEWVRAHPEFARDPRLFNRMMAAHNLAVSDDIQPDSDAYFEAIETTLKIRPAPRAAQEEEYSAASEPQNRRSSPAAAPVSRSAQTSARPGTIRLTPEEVEIAKLTGLTNEEYGRQKMQIKREKELN